MTHGSVDLGAGLPVWRISVHLPGTLSLHLFIPDHQDLLSPDSVKPLLDAEAQRPRTISVRRKMCGSQAPKMVPVPAALMARECPFPRGIGLVGSLI